MDIIQWYPGHMKKAAREMSENIKLVDIVLELVDSRAINETRNPFFSSLIKDKPHILVLMKSDLADISSIKLDKDSILVSIKDKKSLDNLTKKIIASNEKKRKKEISRGIKPSLPRAMIVGIPNIGKSSLINALKKQKIIKVENRAGVTKSERFININNKFILLDTPGILPTNYETSNFVLALTGAIKVELLPIYELSEYAYKFMYKYYPNLLKNRYKSINEDTNIAFKDIANLRGIKNDKTINNEQARSLFLKELRDGILGKVNFDNA